MWRPQVTFHSRQRRARPVLGQATDTQGSPQGHGPATILAPKSPQAAHTHAPQANISRLRRTLIVQH